MMPPGRFPHTIGRPAAGARGAGGTGGQEPPRPVELLRDPRASGAENDPDVPRDPRTDRVGWPESSIDELGRVGVTPPDELTGAGRAALESELEPLSGIPGLYMRGPGGCIVRYELTDAGRAALEQLAGAELERELVGKLAQEDAIDAELAAPVDVVELEPLEELRERVARERAPWLFMGVQLP